MFNLTMFPDMNTVFLGLVFASEKILVTDHSLKGELIAALQ